MPEVGVSKNDASTFKPYNPNEIIGSTSPGLPYIPPPGSNNCAAFAPILTSVILMIAAPYLAPVIQSFGSILTGALIAGGATFVANAAATAIGSALGFNSFSWRASLKEGAVAALTAGFSGSGVLSKLGPISSVINSSQFATAAAQAVLNKGIDIAASKMTGVEHAPFSWKDIAIQAVTQTVVAPIMDKLSEKAFSGIKNPDARLFATKLASSMVSSAVSVGVSRAFGTKAQFNIGTSIGSAFASALSPDLAAMMADPTSGDAGLDLGLSEAQMAELKNDPDGREALEVLKILGQAGDGGALVNSKPNLSGIPIPEGGAYSLPLGELTEKQMLAYESAKAQYTERPLGRNAEQISADAYDVARLVQITEQLDHFNSLLPSVSLKFPEIGKAWTKISEVMTSAIVSKDAYFAESIPGLLPRGVERITSNRDLNAIGLNSRMMVDDASGFYAVAYRNYGTKSILVAFRGTEGDPTPDNPDWRNNLMQLTGNGAKSPQFQRAVQIGQQINKSDFKVSFTGHSLGGGLAATAAVMAQRSAITFNAEGVLRSTIPGVTNAAWNSRNRLIQAINIKGEAVSLAQDSLKFAGASAAAAFELRNPIAALALQRALNLKQPLSITLGNVPSAIGTRTEISANEAFMVRGPYDAGYGKSIVVGHNAMAAHGQSQVIYALTAQYNLAAMNSSYASFMGMLKH